MADVKEKDLPKITSYSDIKELRLIKTDGSSVSMTVDNFINAVAEKIARVDGFASVVAELLNSKSDVGIKTIQPNNGNIAKILQVQQYGRVTILMSHNIYSNTQTVIALVTVYPCATGDCKPVEIKYLQGNKDEYNQYAVKIYSATNTDGSISLFLKTAHYESTGYRVISNYLGEANVVYNVDLPDNAVLI